MSKVDDNTRFYWERIFPWKQICRFLSQGDIARLRNREIAIRHKKYFLRNKCYETIYDIKSTAITDTGDVALRMEFGAIFPGEDRADSRSETMPLFVELRFDIDVQDYSPDNYIYGPGCLNCTHPSRAPACKECWQTKLEPSRKVLAYLLKELLGIEYVLWVFSGKKGYHGIVLDRNVSSVFYSAKARKNIISRLINPKNEAVLDHIYDKILWPLFQEQYLNVPFNIARRPLNAFYCGLERSIVPAADTKVIFNHIKKKIYDGDNDKMKQHYRKVMRAIYWPRLDIDISRKVDHLLKIPFSIHDGTKNISTPLIDPDNFIPENALTLDAVCENPKLLDPYFKHFRRLMDSAYAIPMECDSSDESSEDEMYIIDGGNQRAV